MPKIPIWANFAMPCNGKIWYILLPFGIFCHHLEYPAVFFPQFWNVSPRKIWQPCNRSQKMAPLVDQCMQKHLISPPSRRYPYRGMILCQKKQPISKFEVNKFFNKKNKSIFSAIRYYI
jgi:hypothetical protein